MSILNYKENMSIQQNVLDWLNKLLKRANFSCSIEKCGEIPSQFNTFVGSPDEEGISDYGDQDILFHFSAQSWENWWGDSNRNVSISGYLPIHISKNGRPMFGWCKNNSETPDSLKFTFSLGEKNETYSLHELCELIGDEDSLHCYGNGKVSKFLFSIFLIGYFRKSEKIQDVDNR